MTAARGVKALFLFLLVAGVVGCARRLVFVTTRAIPASTQAMSARMSLPLPTSTVRFRNAAADDGLTYRWPSGGPRPRTILQTMGYGCAFLDYNNDGNLDILLIGPKLALYRGDGHGHFTDVTHQTGLDKLHGLFFGCAVGDYDNDGYDDLYISAYRGGVLLHNVAGRRFQDVTQEVGLKPQPWGTSCAWADLDDDGFLDLVICNYVDYTRSRVQLCKEKNVLTACPPQTYPPLTTVVFRNVGGARFTEATKQFLRTASSGNSLGVAVADADGTGEQDIALANDLRPGDLYRRGPGAAAFTNDGALSGTSEDGMGGVHAGMGVDWGDVDNDGKLDFFVTTFARETKCLYHNLGNRLFEEEAHLAGIGTATWDYVAFGCKFLDADNDGWLDLLIANGHTSDNVQQYSTFTYREPLQFFHNAARSPLAFAEETKTFMEAPLPPLVGRGLAVGDYDNDGRMDALVVDGEGAPVLLHNETPNAGTWLTLRLVGSGKSNRNGYGARVQVTPESGHAVVSVCQAAGSYLSSSDARVHVGLGLAKKADVAIRWPDGREQKWSGLATANEYRLTEGKAAAEPVR